MKRGRPEPGQVIEISGDLLDAKEKYIAQQCNCLTVKSHGLSFSIANRYPWANHYKTRTPIGSRNLAIKKDRDEPGTIAVLQKDDRAVICMFAQWCPGKPKQYKSYPEWQRDTYSNRQKWFDSCLEKMKTLETDSIAFPFRIGCGLANGHWETYKHMIDKFAKESGKKCIIYKLEQTK